MKVVSVARTKPDAQVTTQEIEDSPQYPWGTEVHLDHDTLSALEAANGPLPDVGKTVHIAARGKVTSKDISPDGKRKTARVQLTDMGHEDPEADKSSKAVKSMYSSATDGGDGDGDE